MSARACTHLSLECGRARARARPPEEEIIRVDHAGSGLWSKDGQLNLDVMCLKFCHLASHNSRMNRYNMSHCPSYFGAD